jgi:hypothetical protein
MPKVDEFVPKLPEFVPKPHEFVPNYLIPLKFHLKIVTNKKMERRPTSPFHLRYNL